jgi:hypothetical protein
MTGKILADIEVMKIAINAGIVSETEWTVNTREIRKLVRERLAEMYNDAP